MPHGLSTKELEKFAINFAKHSSLTVNEVKITLRSMTIADNKRIADWHKRPKEKL